MNDQVALLVGLALVTFFVFGISFMVRTLALLERIAASLDKLRSEESVDRVAVTPPPVVPAQPPQKPAPEIDPDIADYVKLKKARENSR